MRRIEEDLPIVAIDVSKNSSHAQGYLGRGRPLSRPFAFEHDRDGLSTLSSAIGELRARTGKEPVAVLEATGVYSEPLVRYLRGTGVEVAALSPMRTHSVGQALTKEGVKSDLRDCATIAEAAYLLGRPEPVSEDLRDSRELVGECARATAELRRAKCRLSRLLDLVFVTAISKFKKRVYSSGFLNLIARYPHPDLVAKCSVRAACSAMAKGTVHSPAYFSAGAKAFREACGAAYSGAPVDGRAVRELSEQARALSALKERSERLHEEVVSTARARFPELFASVSKVPGLSGYTGAALVCFCGGMLIGLTSKQLVSYLGLAPRISQSGLRSGKGLSITKRGDSYMRSLMYLAARTAVAMGSPGFTEYYRRKVSGDRKCGAHTRRSALIATAVKMVGVLHSLATHPEAEYDPQRITGIINH